MKQFKKVMSIVLAATLALSLLSGCAAKAADGEKPTEAAAEETKVSAAPQFPKTFTGEWTGLDGYWHVTADAPVIVPQGPMPVAKVARREFTQEDVDNIIQVLLKGNTLYENLGVTRQQWEARIEELEAIQRGDIPYQGDGTIDRVPGLLEDAKKYVKTAKDENDRIPANTKFHPYEPSPDALPGYTYADVVDGWAEVEGKKVYVDITQYAPEADFGRQAAEVGMEPYIAPHTGNVCAWTQWDNLWGNRDPIQPKLSEADAQKIGDEVIAGIGIPAVLDHMEPVEYFQYGTEEEVVDGIAAEHPLGVSGYKLCYARQVNGRKAGWVNNQYDGGATEDGSKAFWITERLEIYVTDKGEVAYFRWCNPYSDPEIQETDAKLMDFADIQEIFGKMIFVFNDYWREIDAKNGYRTKHELNVDRVVLTLACVGDKDNATEGKLVPVWDFYGTERTQYPKEGKLVWTDPNARSDALIHLTINAMDGTILDRGLSY